MKTSTRPRLSALAPRAALAAMLTASSAEAAPPDAVAPRGPGPGAGDARKSATGSRTAPTDPPLAPGEERPVPDYDGRGDDPTTAGDVALWVPRILLSPLYLVTEYVVRRPLGAFATLVEEEQLYEGARDLFTFGPNDNIAVIPTGLFDFGFRPSVGAYVFWNDLVARDNALRLRVAYGFDGLDWWKLEAADRVLLSHAEELSVRGRYEGRSDLLFHGIGPRSGEAEARFRADVLEGGLRYEADLTTCTLGELVAAGTRCRTSSLRTAVFVRDATFDATQGSPSDEATLGEAIAGGRFPAPPGLADGYTTLHETVELVLDARARRYTHVSPRGEPLPERIEGSDHVPPPGTGARLALRAEHAGGLRRSPAFVPGGSERLEWVRYGATLGGHLDLTGEQRVVGLTATADFAEPLHGDSPIPFRELVSLGGERPLRGFLEGRLYDRSAATVTLDYQYPVWVWLDGAVHYGVGNVFGAHLDGFAPELLRQSFGLGLRTTSTRDQPFEVLLAFGTRTFADGAGVEAVRFVVGTTSGF